MAREYRKFDQDFQQGRSVAGVRDGQADRAGAQEFGINEGMLATGVLGSDAAVIAATRR